MNWLLHELIPYNPQLPKHIQMDIVADVGVKMTIQQYQPKGGMCGNCVKLKHDCSYLDFKKMNVIEENYYFERTVFIVRCSDFLRKQRKPAPNE